MKYHRSGLDAYCTPSAPKSPTVFTSHPKLTLPPVGKHFPAFLTLVCFALTLAFGSVSSRAADASADFQAALGAEITAQAKSIIKEFGDDATEAEIKEFLSKKGLSTLEKDVAQYVAAYREIVVSKRAAPGTELFDRLLGHMLGKKVASSPALPTPEPVSVFVSPSKRYEMAKSLAKAKDSIQEKLRQGVELQETERKLNANPLPFVSNMGTHAIAGVRMVSPYTIKTNTEEGKAPYKTFETDSTEAKPYVELVFSNRWAWRDERIYSASLRNPDKKTRGDWALGSGSFDGDIRIGYVFSKEDKDSPEKVVGLGRFYADLSLGYSIYRGEFDGGAYSFNVEGGGGTVTDGSSFDSNTRYFAGVGFVSRLPGFLGYQDGLRRPTLVAARFGHGWWELPQFADAGSRRIKTRNGDVADFHFDRGAALELEAFIPIRESAYINVGGKVYGTNPNMWSVYLGLTTDLKQLMEAITGK